MSSAESDASPIIRRQGGLSAQDILEEMQQQAVHATETRGVERRVSLRMLLAPGGNQFVETAFRALLGRPPDPAALDYYVGRLRTGDLSKIEVLGKIRYTTDGRRLGVRVPGLLSRYILVRAGRLPGIGSRLLMVVRVLRWPLQVRRTQAELLGGMAMLRDAADGMQRAIASLERLQADRPPLPDRLDDRLQAVEARVASAALEEAWAEPLIALAARVDEQVQRLQWLERQTGDITAVAAVLQGLRSTYGWPDDAPAAFATRLVAVAEDVVRRARQADEVAQRNRIDLLDQSRRLGLLLADVRQRSDRPFTPEEAAGLEAIDDHRLDSLYLAFEERFRGNRADIRERQRAHLPLLREANAGSPERPIVDVGAGRGEWLELLRDEGLQATGVDLNLSMVDLCRSLHLDCVQDDAIGYLRRLPDNSLGAVTGFHIIEHLPFRAFVALLDESRRVLRPDGLVLFETPNPANLLVGSRWFYLDPTHRNPMPAEMTSMIAEARGFVQVHSRELHPMPARFQARDEVLAAQLDRIFHGPQDYALVARKA